MYCLCGDRTGWDEGINYAGLVAAIIGVLQDQEVELPRLRAEVTDARERELPRNEAGSGSEIQRA